MINHRPALVAAMAVLIVLACGAGAAWMHRETSFRQLAAAVRETEACRQAAASIQQLRGGNLPVLRSKVAKTQLYEKIHTAVVAAGIENGQAIRDIRPQPARSDPATHAEVNSVELDLNGVSCQQFVRFMYDLQSGDTPLQVVAFNMRQPSGLGKEARWNVEPIVLSYQVQAGDSAIGSADGQ